MQVKKTPGWYQDPSGQAEYRWWDGNEWTARTNTRQAVLDEALDAKPHRLADWALQRSLLSKVTMAVLALALVAFSVYGLTRVFLQSEERPPEESPGRTVAVSGGPVTLRTCPIPAGDPAATGCPVRITVTRVECGITSLADPTTAAPPNFVPTGTVAPAHGQFCAVGYDVTNTGPTSIASVPVSVRLVADDSNTYSQAADASREATAVRSRFGVAAGTIPPGGTAADAAVVDMPADVDPTEVVFVGGLGVDQQSVALG